MGTIRTANFMGFESVIILWMCGVCVVHHTARFHFFRRALCDVVTAR